MSNKKRAFWRFKENEYWWNHYEFKVLFSYLYRFSKINNIDILNSNLLEFKGPLLLNLKGNIDKLIDDLLTDCYEQPTHKTLSKYSSWYEEIDFKGKIYNVNYRTDSLGIIVFSMYSFAKTLEQAFEENESVTIKY